MPACLAASFMVLSLPQANPVISPGRCDTEISRLHGENDFVRAAETADRCWESTQDRRYLHLAAQEWRFAQRPALALLRIDQYLVESINAKRQKAAQIVARAFHRELDPTTEAVRVVLEPRPDEVVSGVVVFSRSDGLGTPLRLQVTTSNAALLDVRLDAGEWEISLSLADGTTILDSFSVKLGTPLHVTLRREAENPGQGEDHGTGDAVRCVRPPPPWLPRYQCKPVSEEDSAPIDQKTSFPVDFVVSPEAIALTGIELRIRARDGRLAHHLQMNRPTFSLLIDSGVWSAEAVAPNFEPALVRFAVARDGGTGGPVEMQMRRHRELRARLGLAIGFSALALPTMVTGITLAAAHGPRVKFPFGGNDVDSNRAFAGASLTGSGLGIAVVAGTGFLRNPRPAWWGELGAGGTLVSIGLPLLLLARNDIEGVQSDGDQRKSYRRALVGGALAGGGVTLLGSAAVAIVVDTLMKRKRLRDTARRVY